MRLVVEIPVSTSRTYLLFYIVAVVAAIIFIVGATFAFLGRVDMAISLIAVALALFAFGNAVKTEAIRRLWSRVHSQDRNEMRNITIEIDKKVDKILKLLEKEGQKIKRK